MNLLENNKSDENLVLDRIQIGDYIIIQRQKYTKLHKFGGLDSTAMLGNDKIELRNIADKPYFTTFKMMPVYGGGSAGGGGRGGGNGGNRGNNKDKRLNTLEPCTYESNNNIMDMLNVTASGQDNRNIIDDGDSQHLNSMDIVKLRESGQSSSEIVGQIIGNSKTFSSKTEYAQEKYLNKKVKKYFEYVQIKRPTIRLIAEVMYRQDADKIYGLRIDTLSQIISYSNVSCNGNYLLYESGTNGLLPSAMMNSIGANTTGKLIHMHPGNVPQKVGLLAMNYEREQLQRCISVNIYSVLRHYYQSKLTDTSIKCGVKRKYDEMCDGETTENGDGGTGESPSTSKSRQSQIQNDAGCNLNVQIIDKDNDIIMESVNDVVDDDIKKDITGTIEQMTEAGPIDSSSNNNTHKKEKWMLENEMASELLKIKMDSLVIASKEHPLNILKSLLPFVKPSRPVVIFNLSREVLMDLYVEMKAIGEVTNLRLTSNWMRMYQMLPNRTHPIVSMNGNSGYLLYGYTVR